MTLETRQEEEMLEKVRAVDGGFWEIKKRVHSIDTKVDSLAEAFSTLRQDILDALKPPAPAIEPSSFSSANEPAKD